LGFITIILGITIIIIIAKKKRRANKTPNNTQTTRRGAGIIEWAAGYESLVSTALYSDSNNTAYSTK
jgi:hypothetical protein